MCTEDLFLYTPASIYIMSYESVDMEFAFNVLSGCRQSWFYKYSFSLSCVNFRDFLLHGFEFRVDFLLDWLPPNASLLCYLNNSWVGKKSRNKNERNRQDPNLNSARRSHFPIPPSAEVLILKWLP